jgi:hypothetical protein
MTMYLLIGAILLAAGVFVVFVLPRLFYTPRDTEAIAAFEKAPSGEMTGPVTKIDRSLAWPKLIDPDSGALTVEERRSLIDALALVGASWCADILAAAYTEEGDALRENVIDAIGRCDEGMLPTLERAMTSHRVVERYAAVDAASRRGVVPLLERGLRDTDGTVALAAAYGLIQAGRRDLVDAGLGSRDDARAAEIRRALPALV